LLWSLVSTDSLASNDELEIGAGASVDRARNPWVCVNSAVAPQAIEASNIAAS